MTENEKFIYDSIYDQVRMGFSSFEDIKESILEQIEDNEFTEEISTEWSIGMIEKELEKVLAESKSWESPTDTERLISAFDELCELNFIALHNAGVTSSDGEYEVVEVEGILRESGVASNGYCFYHEQDLSRAITPTDSSLYIAYQKINNSDDKVTLEVGQKVTEILRKRGLKVEWENDINTKILLPGFKWQYLYLRQNRDLMDYNEVVDRILKFNLKPNESQGSSDKKPWWKRLLD